MWELQLRIKEFFALTFLLVTGYFGMFMSLDLFFLFIWFDVSLFPMYLLIAVWGSTDKEYGALKLTLYLLAGSALILPGLIYLHAQSGLNTFDILTLSQPEPLRHPSRNLRLCCFNIGSASWPASGRFIPGRRRAMSPPRPQSA
jgi:NADH-quinone oxidoreductase subunit M